MSDTIRELFAKNLRYLMNARGITQADICRELNVSSATVSDWCSGKKCPRVDKMQKLADMLGVRLSTLTSETSVQDFEDQEILEALHQDPELRMLFSHARSMPHEDVVFMQEFAERLKKTRNGE